MRNEIRIFGQSKQKDLHHSSISVYFDPFSQNSKHGTFTLQTNLAHMPITKLKLKGNWNQAQIKALESRWGEGALKGMQLSWYSCRYRLWLCGEGWAVISGSWKINARGKEAGSKDTGVFLSLSLNLGSYSLYSMAFCSTVSRLARGLIPQLGDIFPIV